MRATTKLAVALALVATPAAAEPPMRAATFQRSSAYSGLGDAGPYFPDRAARMGATAVVIMDCHAEANGRLSACLIIDMTNREFGFEFAALKMAERGWMTAGPPPEGVAPPDDGVWRFRVIFDGKRR